MRKSKYESVNQYFQETKGNTLSKLLGRPQEKTYLQSATSRSPILSQKQSNESIKFNTSRNYLQKPMMNNFQQPSYSKPKNSISSSNNSIDDNNFNSINSENEDKRRGSPNQSSGVGALYGLSNRSKASKKPILTSSSKLNTSKNSINSGKNLIESKESDFYRGKIATTHIDLKQPIEALKKDENSQEIYLQVIKMRQQEVKTPIERCSKHDQKFKFNNFERSIKYCCICAVEEAYKGSPLIFISNNQLLAPQIDKPQTPVKPNPLTWDLDIITQQQNMIGLQTKEFLLKREDLKLFLQQMKDSYELIIKITNDYQKYSITSNPREVQRQSIDQLSQNIAGIIKKYLQNQFKFNEDEQLCRILLEKTKYLTTFQNDIQCIRNDIVHNLENILKSMEIEPFQLILQKYRNKIKTFESSIRSSHNLMQEQFGVIFSDSVIYSEESLLIVQKWINALIRNDQDSFQQMIQSKSQQIYVSFENKDIFKVKSNKENDFEKANDLEKANDFEAPVQPRLPNSKFIDLMNVLNQQTRSPATLYSDISLSKINDLNNSESREHERKSNGRTLLNSPHFNDIDSLYKY